MWAQVPDIIGYNGQGIETPVRAGTYKATDTNAQWTSIIYDGRAITIYTFEITNLSGVDPTDDRPPSKGGWDFGFEWQLPKFIKAIRDWFVDVFNVTKDVAIIVFWLLLAFLVLFVWRKTRPTRVRVVD